MRKSTYVCSECGYDSVRWLGRCPACGKWNTFTEEAKNNSYRKKDKTGGTGPVPVTHVRASESPRLSSGIAELDRVLGGGIVPGSVVLIGGEPGVGKSTLLLQVASVVAESVPVLYVSGEESQTQVRLRAERTGALQEGLYVLSTTDMDEVEEAVRGLRPSLAVIDSIQTMQDSGLETPAGSVGQVREGTSRLVRLAKEEGIPLFLVGHINKDGGLAGPKVLEHIVDVVIYFEGEKYSHYRVLRAAKNRFGSTNEIGIFEMAGKGLVGVANPSELLLAERPDRATGSVVAATIEGTRPLLVEIQALVTVNPFGTPRRTTNGLDHNRVALLMAVLEKRCGMVLSNQDAYLKVAGGIRLEEPAVDLAAALAIASAYRNRPVNGRLVAVGEVGLGGEIRGVSRLDERLREAARLGFDAAIVPVSGQPVGEEGLKVIRIASLGEALEYIG